MSKIETAAARLEEARSAYNMAEEAYDKVVKQLEEAQDGAKRRPNTGTRLIVAKAAKRLERATEAKDEADAACNAADSAYADLALEQAGRQERGTTWEDQVQEEEDVLDYFYRGGPGDY